MITAVADGYWLTVSGKSAISNGYSSVHIAWIIGLTVSDNNAIETMIPITGYTGLLRNLDLRGLTGAGGYVFWNGPGNNTIYGSALGDYIYSYGSGHDILNGYAGNDSLYGNEGNDRINGGVGDDALQGGAGNDILVGGRGNDLVDGGDGQDTFVFTGQRAEYDVSVVNGNNYVISHVGGTRIDGVDTFGNIEALQFADQTVVMTDFLLL